jgi:hypothetical protein
MRSTAWYYPVWNYRLERRAVAEDRLAFSNSIKPRPSRANAANNCRSVRAPVKAGWVTVSPSTLMAGGSVGSTVTPAMANTADVVEGAAVVTVLEGAEVVTGAATTGIAGKTSAGNVVVVSAILCTETMVVEVVVVVVVTTVMAASPDFETSGPTTGRPVAVATLVNEAVSASVVQE